MSTAMLKITDKRRIALDLKKLRQLREDANLTMEQAAKLAGFPNRQRWYDVESGRKSNIKLSTLDSIAKALGCLPKDLLK
jgi:transcriptional regulator with XRE-family HTH domain